VVDVPGIIRDIQYHNRCEAMRKRKIELKSQLNGKRKPKSFGLEGPGSMVILGTKQGRISKCRLPNRDAARRTDKHSNGRGNVVQKT
jgi:hypothetical protein